MDMIEDHAPHLTGSDASEKIPSSTEDSPNDPNQRSEDKDHNKLTVPETPPTSDQLPPESSDHSLEEPLADPEAEVLIRVESEDLDSSNQEDSEPDGSPESLPESVSTEVAPDLAGTTQDEDTEDSAVESQEDNEEAASVAPEGEAKSDLVLDTPEMEDQSDSPGTDTPDSEEPETDLDQPLTAVDSDILDEKTHSDDPLEPEAKPDLISQVDGDGATEGMVESTADPVADYESPADDKMDENDVIETAAEELGVPEEPVSSVLPVPGSSESQVENIQESSSIIAPDEKGPSESPEEGVDTGYQDLEVVKDESEDGSTEESDLDQDDPLADRYQNLVRKCENLRYDVDTIDSKADVLLQIESMLEYLQEVNVPGDLDQLIADLESMRERVNEYLLESLKEKEALCEQAEEIRDSEEWENTSEKFSELQREWRRIGQVPFIETDQIWNRFRAARDTFLERYKIHLKEERHINLIEREKLCAQAEEFSTSTDWRKAGERIADLQKEWKQIGELPSGKAGEVNGRFKEAVNKFYERRDRHIEKMDRERHENLAIKEKLCVIAESIKDSDDWVKTGQQFIKLQQDWNQIGPVPQEISDELWGRFCGAADYFFLHRNRFYEKRDAEMLDNLHQKEKLCEAAEGIKDSVQWNESGKKLIQLQEEWRQIGPVPRDKSDEIWDRFRAANDEFFERRKQFYKKQEQTRRENLRLKRELCAEAEGLLPVTDWKHTEAKLKELQKSWKEIGPLPRAKSDTVWQRFRQALDLVYEQRQQYYDSVRQENQTRKEELCQIAEELSTSTDWKNTAERFKALQKEWKDTGPLPQEKSEELWERFRKAADTFFLHRNEFYATEDSEWRDHLKQKEALCEAAEALAEVNNWKTGEDKIQQLQLEWKQVGFIPNEIADAVWHRFRKAIGVFYANRNSFFKDRDKLRKDNLELKEAICAEVESFADSHEVREAERRIIELRAKWKEIGPVPRNKSDAVWQRFRRGMDQFYNKRGEEYETNLNHKIKLCEEVEALDVSANLQGAIDRVKELQIEWKKIGPVPQSKMQSIWRRFKTGCDRVFEISRLERAGRADEWKLKLYDTFLKSNK